MLEEGVKRERRKRGEGEGGDFYLLPEELQDTNSEGRGREGNRGKGPRLSFFLFAF